jgi:hypothetical protein
VNKFGGAKKMQEILNPKENLASLYRPWFCTPRTKTTANHVQEHRHHQEPLYSKYGTGRNEQYKTEAALTRMKAVDISEAS